jgi:hypothetical protein
MKITVENQTTEILIDMGDDVTYRAAIDVKGDKLLNIAIQDDYRINNICNFNSIDDMRKVANAIESFVKSLTGEACDE